MDFIESIENVEFRAQTIKDKKWVYGNYYNDNGEHFIVADYYKQTKNKLSVIFMKTGIW